MLCEHKCEFKKHVTPDYGTVIKRVRQENDVQRNVSEVSCIFAYAHIL